MLIRFVPRFPCLYALPWYKLSLTANQSRHSIHQSLSKCIQIDKVKSPLSNGNRLVSGMKEWMCIILKTKVWNKNNICIRELYINTKMPLRTKSSFIWRLSLDWHHTTSRLPMNHQKYKHHTTACINIQQTSRVILIPGNDFEEYHHLMLHSISELTHWDPWNVNVIFKVYFPKSLYGKDVRALVVKSLIGKYHMISL